MKKLFQMFPGHESDRRRQYATAAMSAMCHGCKILSPDEVKAVVEIAFRVADEMIREEERTARE